MSELYEYNQKVCQVCKTPLPDAYPGDLCPICEENSLFSEVKEYIRSNVVNEYMVAEKFNLPLSKIKSWIKEGRIEYSSDKKTTIKSTKCQSCGKPVLFGTICSDCIKKMNAKKGVYMETHKEENGQMRFLKNHDE